MSFECIKQIFHYKYTKKYPSEVTYNFHYKFKKDEIVFIFYNLIIYILFPNALAKLLLYSCWIGKVNMNIEYSKKMK